MDRTPQSFLKASPPASSSSSSPSLSSPRHYILSPPELIRPIDRFISPAPSSGRASSSEPLPSMHLRMKDKMSIAAATNPSLPSLLSPPESPETPHITLRRAPSRGGDDDDGDILMVDEPLLPEDGASISLETPLFQVNEKDEPLIQQVAAKRAHQAPPGVRPSAEDYRVFVSSAWRLYQSNPMEWLRREQRYNAMYGPSTASVCKRSTPKSLSPSVPSTKRSTPTPRPAPRPRSSAAYVATASATTTPQRSSSAQRAARVPRSAPKFLQIYDETQAMSPPRSSPAPRQRLTAPTREDSNFEALPDVTPPLASLPSDRCLQTDWRGNPLSIDSEPHFDLLHPAEAKLASILRLTPAIYLSSKRRIFIEKVRRTQIGKEFRKTDSQKACKIDVNKASKLWTAFDKVGWFDRKFIEPHLNKEIDIES